MLSDLKSYPFFQGNDGLLYHFDINRSKWLSVNRETMDFGINAKNIKGKRYMASTGRFYSNLSGSNLLRDATITSISIQTSNIGSFDINLHKNKINNSIYSISINNDNSKIVDNINFDLFRGDFLQVSLDNNNIAINYPEILIEYCWRITY
jgi:hypothetical protein